MSDTNKNDYSWIGMLLLLLLIGWGIVEVLPFNIYINILIAILAVVLIVALFIGGAIGLVLFFWICFRCKRSSHPRLVGLLGENESP